MGGQSPGSPPHRDVNHQLGHGCPACCIQLTNRHSPVREENIIPWEFTHRPATPWARTAVNKISGCAHRCRVSGGSPSPIPWGQPRSGHRKLLSRLAQTYLAQQIRTRGVPVAPVKPEALPPALGWGVGRRKPGGVGMPSYAILLLGPLQLRQGHWPWGQHGKDRGGPQAMVLTLPAGAVLLSMNIPEAPSRNRVKATLAAFYSV